MLPWTDILCSLPLWVWAWSVASVALRCERQACDMQKQFVWIEPLPLRCWLLALSRPGTPTADYVTPGDCSDNANNIKIKHSPRFRLDHPSSARRNIFDSADVKIYTNASYPFKVLHNFHSKLWPVSSHSINNNHAFSCCICLMTKDEFGCPAHRIPYIRSGCWPFGVWGKKAALLLIQHLKMETYNE